jgi:hypothetical protein
MAENPLTHKLGPLPLYQWLLIGGGLGAAIYLYEKDHKSTAEEPKEELAGSTNNPLTGGGGGGESGTGGGSVPGVAGPIGEPGPAGAPGAPAPAPEVSAAKEAAAPGLNTPPVGTEIVASQLHGAANPSDTYKQVNAKGEHYKTIVKKDGEVIHQYIGKKKGEKGRQVVVKPPRKGTTKAGDTAKRSHARKPPLKAVHKPPPRPKQVAPKAKPPPKKKKKK